MDEPADEGIRYLGPPCDSRGMIVKHKLNVGFAESLAAMTDYQFFTPAVLYLHGAFTDGPLIDFMFNEQRDIRLHYHVSRTKIFNGLEAPSNGNVLWNHALWAVVKEDWEPLRDFLLGCSFNHTDSKWLVRIGETELTIPDPLAIEKGVYSGVDLKVSAFGINTNRGQMGLGHTPPGLPTLRLEEPDPELVVFANAVFAGDDPHKVLALHRATEAKREQSK